MKKLTSLQFLISRSQKAEDFKCFRGKLIQKLEEEKSLEEKLEELDILLSAHCRLGAQKAHSESQRRT